METTALLFGVQVRSAYGPHLQLGYTGFVWYSFDNMAMFPTLIIVCLNFSITAFLEIFPYARCNVTRSLSIPDM